jgi:hypothetical protein
VPANAARKNQERIARLDELHRIQVAGSPYNPENHPGPEFADARDWLISNNTFAFNQNRAGIVIWQRRATDCIIQNNIFYKNSVTLRPGAVQGIDFVAAGGGHVIRNNLFFAPDRRSIDKSGAADAIGNIEGKDPLFVAAEQANFRLRPQSPAINAGFAEGSPDVDIEGKLRPRAGPVAIGAYQNY